MLKVGYLFGACFFAMVIYHCNALICHECDKTIQEAMAFNFKNITQNTRVPPSIDIPHYCLGPNDLGNLNTCKEGEVCSKDIQENNAGIKLYARYCKLDPGDESVGKCLLFEIEGTESSWYKVCLNNMLQNIQVSGYQYDNFQANRCMCKADKCNSGSGLSIDNENGGSSGGGSCGGSGADYHHTIPILELVILLHTQQN